MKTNVFNINSLAPVKDENVFDTSNVIRDRFKLLSAVMKSYVRHMQEVENVDYKTAQTKAYDLANSLVEKHNLGSLFIRQTSDYLRQQYRPDGISFKNEMVRAAGIEDPNILNMLLNELRESKEFMLIDPTFRRLI